jgi:hypothetical protein
MTEKQLYNSIKTEFINHIHKHIYRKTIKYSHCSVCSFDNEIGEGCHQFLLDNTFFEINYVENCYNPAQHRIIYEIYTMVENVECLCARFVFYTYGTEYSNTHFSEDSDYIKDTNLIKNLFAKILNIKNK